MVVGSVAETELQKIVNEETFDTLYTKTKLSDYANFQIKIVNEQMNSAWNQKCHNSYQKMRFMVAALKLFICVGQPSVKKMYSGKEILYYDVTSE